ncbi:DUF397 domain-containing protein [Streptomyces sp. NPDC101455]|uniref:DUF397 domain-containing protein n=1 Tax=Streptomyces sp. NPDC101455 TaxID=3366142 RepID=UPI00380511F8
MTHERDAAPRPATAMWRKSTYSGGQGECVEFADNIPDLAPVRDSKTPTGPVIRFGRAAWSTFVTQVK